MNYDIVVCGIGGQGVVTLGKIIMNAALKEGLEATLMENRGHAKRYDSVSCHVRIGKNHSTIIPKKNADLMIGLESTEVLRHKALVKKDADFIVNAIAKENTSSVFGENAVHLDSGFVIKEMGNLKDMNLFFLGAVSKLESFPINKKNLADSIREIMKNRESYSAFEFGRENK